jgi:hypothetical protein
MMMSANSVIIPDIFYDDLFLHMIVSFTTVPLSPAATIRPIFVTGTDNIKMSANSVIIPDTVFFMATIRPIFVTEMSAI